MQLGHGAVLSVSAAHSRVIQPGDRVDFDEVIHPTNGSPYTLEQALGPDADRFTAAPEPEPDVVDLPVIEPVTGDVSTVTESTDDPAAAVSDDAPVDAQPAAEPEPVVKPKATGRGKRK